MLSQAKCLGKVKLAPLEQAFVEVSQWEVEAKAGSLGRLALEETASLDLLVLGGRHHISLVSLVIGVCLRTVETRSLSVHSVTGQNRLQVKWLVSRLN